MIRHLARTNPTARALAASAAAAAALLAPPPAHAQSTSADFDASVRRTIMEAGLGPSTVGVVVIDPDTRQILTEHNPNRSLIPASNMKLFTSAVALAVLGNDFSFTTTLSVLPANQPADPPALLVTADGDPGFADPELLRDMGLAPDELTAVWAQAAAQAARDAGTDRFSELIIDDRVFDDQTVHPTWPTDALNRWYCAEVAGLNFHANLVELYTEPTTPGNPPAVRAIPEHDAVRIRNRARSVEKGRQTAWAARELGTNNLTLFGDVRRTGGPINVALTNNADLFADYLADDIAQRGVSVGPHRRARNDETFPNARPIHTIRTPIATALRRCNQDSYNLYAEALLKRTANAVTGAPGSWERGAAVVEMMVQKQLDRAGVSSVRIADGSGMSRDNRVTAMAVAEWLTAIANEPALANTFIDSLATETEGTRGVRRLAAARLHNRVFAKSGYLRGTYALSGYLIDEQTDDKVVFAMLVNDKPASVPAKNVHDLFLDIATLTDEWLEENERADRNPLGG